ncbi:MAG: right-handed parallel beta-helix repeat-containing protein [Verrucomicrobiales bacterium]|nr:right-handed parallel beta-helix repeat-containing protein [Verrucomicrobiales bacterium]
MRSVDDQPCSPLVTNNHCFRNMGVGIGSMNGSSAIIQNNTCYENEASGIGAQSANPTILHNEIEGNKTAGIGINGESDAVLIGNALEGTGGGTGVFAREGSRVILSENKFTGYRRETSGSVTISE